MEIIPECDAAKVAKLEETFLPRLTEEVRAALLNTHNLLIPSESTGFLVRCLRVKDYDPESAARLVKNFIRSNQRIHDMLDRFQPHLCQPLYTSELVTVLKSRDHLGRKVILTRVANWDSKLHDFDQTACALMLLFMYVVGDSPETQRKGIVFINDMTGLGIRHVRALKLGRLTQLVGMLQDGAPGRIKGLHVIFHPKIVGVLYKLVKPFLKEKLSKRTHFHGDDLTSLHKHIGVEILPASLGGKMGEEESMDRGLIDKLIKSKSVHRQLKADSVPPY